MTAFYGNNIVLSKDGLIVTIATTPDDTENLTKTLILITPPKSGSQQSSDPTDPDYGAYITKIIDLLMKCEQRITIGGFLVTGLGTDSHDDAQSKKSDLKKIFLGGGAATMTYEGSSVTVGIEKLDIQRVNTEGLAASSGEAEFSIKMTCVRGTDFG